MSSYAKNLLRTITGSKSRFLAILAIIALGVGFFSGLKVTTPSFYKTGEDFIENQKLFDIRFISTIGFDEDDITKISELDGVETAAGASYSDAISTLNGEDYVVRFHTLTEGVNVPSLTYGRMPQADNEVVVDGYRCDESDVGKTITLSDINSEDTLDSFTCREYKIVGVIRSPYYLNFQRGTTDIGGGKLDFYVYLPEGGLDFDYYSECFVYLDTGLPAYDDSYTDYIDSVIDGYEDDVQAISEARFDDSLDDKLDEIEDAREELSDAASEAVPELLDAETALFSESDISPEALAMMTPEMIAEMRDEYISGLREYLDSRQDFEGTMERTSRYLGSVCGQISSLSKPEVYALGRDTNVGYVCFDNDADIVDAIAKVFPLFFFAIAALVCSTTMQRMVTDDRGFIGTMMALGYSKVSVLLKYAVYAGLAGTIGCFIGYYAGTWIFPYVIWEVYKMMYGFAPLTFAKDNTLLFISLAVSLLCSVGITVLTALEQMTGVPADLIRPKAPPSGKRILLEKMGFIWKHLRFQDKVSCRNVFRFKKRMWMMLFGIAGCTALVITAMGLNDSITDIIDIQFDTIQTYDLNISFDDESDENDILADVEKADESFGSSTEAVLFNTENLTHTGVNAVRDVTLFSSSEDNAGDAIHLIDNETGEDVSWPKTGYISISSSLAEENDIKEGDTVVFGYGDAGQTFSLTVENIVENHTFHYAYMNAETYEEVFEEEWTPDTALLILGENGPDGHEYGSFFGGLDGVKSWTAVSDSRTSFRSTMQQMNAVVYLVLGCAAALAFIVMFNLNNINISERVREIATVKVLGFTFGETNSYIFRENLMLVIMGFVLGLPLGIILHAFVMDQIKMDMVSFVVQIKPMSYFYSFLMVMLFMIIVDLVMIPKIRRIDMAESLKSVE